VGFGECQIPHAITNGALQLDIDEETARHWLYVACPKG